MNKRQIGNMGENFAAEYLIKHGVNIISKNYRVRSGEIDIIGLDKGILVFMRLKQGEAQAMEHRQSQLHALNRPI